MQHAQETDPETKPKGIGGFRFIEQRRIIQGQFGQGITEIFIVIRTHREHARIDLRLDLLEPGKGLNIRRLGQRQGIAHRRTVDVLDAAAHPAHLTGFQLFGLGTLGGEDAELIHHMGLTGGFHQNLVAFLEHAMLHTHQRNHTQIVIEPGINDQRLQIAVTLTFRGGDSFDQLLQQVINAHPGLGGHPAGIHGVQPDDFLDLVDYRLRLGLRQVDLVQNRQHFQVLLDGGIAVGDGLGFHALGCVHHQQRPFTGRQGAGHLVREVHVSGGINEIQLVGLAITGRVVQRHALRLDGDATLTLQLHGIQHLFFELTLTEAATDLNKAVRQRGFTMIDVGDDGEVANILDVSHRACKQSVVAAPARGSGTVSSPEPGDTKTKTANNGPRF